MYSLVFMCGTVYDSGLKMLSVALEVPLKSSPTPLGVCRILLRIEDAEW